MSSWVGEQRWPCWLDPFKIGLNDALNGLRVTTLRWWKNGCLGPVALLISFQEKLFQKFRTLPPSCVAHLGQDPVGTGLLRVQKDLGKPHCLPPNGALPLPALPVRCLQISEEQQAAVA